MKLIAQETTEDALLVERAKRAARDDLLEDCFRQFNFYATQHERAAAVKKALVNREFADRINHRRRPTALRCGSAGMTLSIETIEAAQPGDLIRDKIVPGLQLRARAARKSFFLYYSVGNRERRPKIGDYPTITLSAARRIAKDMLTAIAAGGDPSADRQGYRAAPTVKDLCARYMEKHGDLKKSAAEDRRMAGYVSAKIGALKVRDVKTSDIEDLHAGLAKTPFRANRTLSLCSKMFNLAEKWDLRPARTNPCYQITRFKEPKRRRYAKSHEAAKIVERLRFYETSHIESVAFLWLLIYTGARPGEIASLLPRHRHGAKLVLAEHKTEDSSDDDRTIQLPPQAVAILDRLPRRKAGETLLGIKSPRRLWRKIRADTKINNLRMYDLRHTFASLALSYGLSLGGVAELLGHKSPATSTRYAHLIDEAAQAAAARTADAFDAFAKPKLAIVK